MMGWLALALMALLGTAALWLLKVRGPLLKLAAAALLLGACGYALQGRPGLSSAPAPGSRAAGTVPLSEARHAFFGRFSGEESWLAMADALARSGDTENAARLLRNAVGRYPRSPQLWVGLGNALVDHARGLTPPAELAYVRAAELAPGHPAPAFFYGLALARSGDRQGAVAMWKRVLATAPPDAGWRPLVEQGVAALSAPPGQAATGS